MIEFEKKSRRTIDFGHLPAKELITLLNGKPPEIHQLGLTPKNHKAC